MKNRIIICLIGAGSSYTPEIIKGIIGLSEDELPVGRINMFDVDFKRLKIMTELSQRMLKAAGKIIEISSFQKLQDALNSADFVVTQVRVGGMEARIKDEKIPLKYGIIGQETTGPGGMFKALRTIPEMLEIADAVAKFAPEAFILNYTNPSGIITEAVTKYSKAKIIGLCSGIPGMQEQLKAELEKYYPEISSFCIGLNHLGFIHRIFSGDQDITRAGIDKLLETGQDGKDNGRMSVGSQAKFLQAVPIGYVNYYLHRASKLDELRKSSETRGETVLKIQERVLKEAALTQSASYPEELKKRGGGGYAKVTFDCMKAIWQDKGKNLACSVPCKGSVKNIDDDAVVEVICRIDRNGATPLSVGEIPPAFRGIIQAVKAYETLTVEAAVKKDINLAYQALINHPLVGDLDIVIPLVDEMMKAHQLHF